MSIASKKKLSFTQKLRNKYRLVILNDETFEEQASFKLSRFNLYVLTSTLLVVLVLLTISTIVFTPLKYYIPGYGDKEIRRKLIALRDQADSLSRESKQREVYAQIVRGVLIGDIDANSDSLNYGQMINYDSIDLDQIPEEDIQLRRNIENEENYQLSFSRTEPEKKKSDLSDLYFYTPINGFITSEFEPTGSHFGIDIVAPKNEPIKAILDGTVISTSWTLKTGYVIVIQHDNGLISFYKHNSVLLKKVGNFVSSGDVIAIIGNSGEVTDGPHLHFELWHNGVAINPKDYIIF